MQMTKSLHSNSNQLRIGPLDQHASRVNRVLRYGVCDDFLSAKHGPRYEVTFRPGRSRKDLIEFFSEFKESTPLIDVLVTAECYKLVTLSGTSLQFRLPLSEAMVK
jgi:hypothetical protein